MALNQMDLPDGPGLQSRGTDRFDLAPHLARLAAALLDATDGQVRPEGAFLLVIAETLRPLPHPRLDALQRIQITAEPGPDHARVPGIGKTTDALEGERKGCSTGAGLVQGEGKIGQAFAIDVAEEPQIGRASCRERV